MIVDQRGRSLPASLVEAGIRRSSRLVVTRNAIVRAGSVRLGVYEHAKQNDLQASLYAHGMARSLAGALLIAVTGLA